MASSQTATRPLAYDSVQKTLHWLVTALVVLQFVLAWTMPEIKRGQPATGLVDLHLSVGATILVLLLLRLAWRVTHPVPPVPDDLPVWQQWASRMTHYAFYVLLVVMPLAGWAWASGRQYYTCQTQAHR